MVLCVATIRVHLRHHKPCKTDMIHWRENFSRGLHANHSISRYILKEADILMIIYVYGEVVVTGVGFLLGLSFSWLVVGTSV